jgi:hypothetical protein
MWEPRRFTTLWTSTVCTGNALPYLYFFIFSSVTGFLNTVLALYANHQIIPKEYVNIALNHTYKIWNFGYIPVIKASPNQQCCITNCDCLEVGGSCETERTRPRQSENTNVLSECFAQVQWWFRGRPECRFQVSREQSEKIPTSSDGANWCEVARMLQFCRDV